VYLFTDGPLESEGSTKHIPVIVLDGDNDERGKLQENPKVSDQVVQENKKGEFTSGKINLNCVESPEESPLDLNDSSVQRNQVRMVESYLYHLLGTASLVVWHALRIPMFHPLRPCLVSQGLNGIGMD
jgi:hypothetical protein